MLDRCECYSRPNCTAPPDSRHCGSSHIFNIFFMLQSDSALGVRDLNCDSIVLQVNAVYVHHL